MHNIDPPSYGIRTSENSCFLIKYNDNKTDKNVTLNYKILPLKKSIKVQDAVLGSTTILETDPAHELQKHKINLMKIME